jgi:hypothetical protein
MSINAAPTQPDASFVGVDEPGNGGRYEYMVWRVGAQWFAAFPDYGRASRIGSGHHHVSYVAEKFHATNPDAEVMTDIINRCIEAGRMEARS